MQSNAANNLTPLPEPRRQATPQRTGSDAAAFTSSQAIEQRLNDLTAVRTAAVERAGALIGDRSYPPDETVQRIANLLAVHLPTGEN